MIYGLDKNTRDTIKMGKVERSNPTHSYRISFQEKGKKFQRNQNVRNRPIHNAQMAADSIDKSKKFVPKNNQTTGNQVSVADGRIKKKKKKNKKSFNKFLKVQDQEITSTTTVKDEKDGSSVPAAGKQLSTSSVQQRDRGKVHVKRESLSSLWLDYKTHFKLLIHDGEEWRSQLIAERGGKDDTDASTKIKLKELGAQILQQDTLLYSRLELKGVKGKEVKFRRTVFTHGTSKDKLAAHVLRCMEAPAHSLSNLNALISMITPKAKSGFTEIFDSLKELLQSTYIPEGQTARRFESHNFITLIYLDREQAEKQLALWYFEDQLAYVYLRLVKHLLEIGQNTVDKTKVQGIRCLVHLVSSNPAQDLEGAAMKAVVYKLGDPNRKVAAQTMYHLRSLLFRRSELKTVVVDHIEDMMYRTNLNGKAQYYCLCFLKDIIFGAGDQQLAQKLLNVYFGFFKGCTTKGEVDTRIMAVLLRGINRAYPYAQQSGGSVDEQLDTLYKLCHIVNFGIATQALQLIYQVTRFQNKVSDRFYQVIYSQILDTTLGISSATNAFLNLVFKAMVRDQSPRRVLAFVKRLFQVSMYQNPNVAAGIVFLVSEVVKEKPGLSKLMPRMLGCTSDSFTGGGVDNSKDCLETLNDNDNVSSEVSQSITDIKTKGGVYVAMGKRENHLLDFDAIQSSEDAKGKVMNDKDSSNKPVTPDAMDDTSRICHQTSYDPLYRNPLYAGANNTSVWELYHLKTHYHPSVALYAEQVLAGKYLEYSGDPLLDYTLMKFLDKFVYRNPKQNVNQDDTAGGHVFGSKEQYSTKGIRNLVVNSSSFAELEPTAVPADHIFFHRYFTQHAKPKKEIKDEDEDEDDNESVGDDEFDDYLSKINGAARSEEWIEDLDFASGTKSASGNKKRKRDDEEEDDDDDEDENLDDDEDDDDDGGFGGQEVDFGDGDDFEGGDEEDDELGGGDEEDDELGGGDEEFGGNDWDPNMSDDDMDFDEEDVAFSDEDDSGMSKPKKKKTDLGTFVTKKGKKRSDDGAIFASAEKFAHILSENANQGIDTTSTQALVNKDRASAKQIKWEIERERKISGQTRRRKKFRKSTHKKFAGNKMKGNKKFQGKKGQSKNSKRGRK
ncbi:hypothetical protein Pcinc_031899 [Petrolisthes cinctipes]|uniref:CCAAT-binding factor domain-containing protein n=1 Tax=Petrolisthes cinctipes TaxID=88211 RepID=A0AAE1K3X4_PETCI|nr:hypothetical protein Pcinc_031899 [Petrolisthes cinctipes]